MIEYNLDLPLGDPLFGKHIPCPACRPEDYRSFLLQHRNKKSQLFERLKVNWADLTETGEREKAATPDASPREERVIEPKPEQDLDTPASDEGITTSEVIAIEQTLLPELAKEEFQTTTFNHSQFSLFQQCKFRYKAKHIDKRLRQDQRTTFYLSVGRSLHLALAEIFRPSKTKLSLRENAGEVLKRVWIKEGFSSSQEEREWFGRCIGMLNRFLEQENVGEQTVLIETEFTGRVSNLTLSSRVDRIDRVGVGECDLIDYKVGSAEINRDQVVDDLQWAFHYLASRDALLRLNLRIRAIVFCFLQAGENILITPEDDLVAQATSKIETVAQEIKEEKGFPPTLNEYCGDCRFDVICPAIQDLKRRGFNPTEVTAKLG